MTTKQQRIDVERRRVTSNHISSKNLATMMTFTSLNQRAAGTGRRARYRGVARLDRDCLCYRQRRRDGFRDLDLRWTPGLDASTSKTDGSVLIAVRRWHVDDWRDIHSLAASTARLSLSVFLRVFTSQRPLTSNGASQSLPHLTPRWRHQRSHSSRDIHVIVTRVNQPAQFVTRTSCITSVM